MTKYEHILFSIFRYAIDGMPYVRFLAYVNISRANASTITESIVKTLEQHLHLTKQVIFERLVGFGSDGAAVMTGCKSGVATVLKKEQPCLFTIHCMAHRLELSFKTFLDNFSFTKSLMECLEAIYKFYHNSSLNRSNLKVSCAAANITFLVPGRVGGTRWLPHTMAALQTLWKLYPALIEHFEQVQIFYQFTFIVTLHKHHT